MKFIRIATKLSSSYIISTKQFNHRVLLPLITMCRLSHNFLNSISTDISDAICWYEDKRNNDLEIERYRMHNNSSSIDS